MVIILIDALDAVDSPEVHYLKLFHEPKLFLFCTVEPTSDLSRIKNSNTQKLFSVCKRIFQISCP